jgi:uncharacterized protein (UPF0264 family)
MSTGLLASVIAAEELAIIGAPGISIIDVKNIDEGPLGAGSSAVVRAAARMLAGKGIDLSVSIGDVPPIPGLAALAAIGAASLGADWVKLGSRDLDGLAEARHVLSATRGALRQAAPDARLVLAGYADSVRFGGLSLEQLLDTAASTGCDAVLVDTQLKDGSDIFDHLGYSDLARWIDACRARGLRTALAGSLGIDRFDAALALGPDWIGLRGALCEDPDRRRISPARVAAVCEAFARAKASSLDAPPN